MRRENIVFDSSHVTVEYFMVGLWLLSLPALSFQSHPDVYIGSEPERIRRFHKERQTRFRKGQHWQSFVSGVGKGWLARFDERTGVPTAAWGPSIHVGDPQSLSDAETIVRRFFANSSGLLGVDLSELRLGRSGYDDRSKTWFIHLKQYVPKTDIPVWRGGVRVQIRNGHLLGFGVDTMPGLEHLDPNPSVTEKDAVDIAVRKGPAAQAKHENPSAKLMVLPQERQGTLVAPLVWEVRSKTETPIGQWVSFVDATTGELLNVHNTVRFLSGTVYAEHDVRTVDGELTTSPMPWMRVQGDGGSTYTDEDGGWDLETDSSPSGDLNGDYARIYNQQGSDASFEALGEETVLTDADASQAELSAYVHQAHIRQWGLEFAPEVDLMSRQLDIYVNINDNCNAYFDGNLNFMRAGSGCNNTARIADVNYHEWGHAFHYYSLITGEFDGSISEGISDVVSVLNTGDPVMAPGFFSGGGGIREVESDRVYPDDWTNEVHTDGLIFAGAMWDLYEILREDTSEEEAFETVSRLLAGTIKSGPTIPQSFEAIMMADDDNFNLGDGTPNGCSIIDAFSRHGLGPGGDRGALVVLEHESVASALPEEDIVLTLEGVNMAPECVEAELDMSTVHYSTDGGQTWDTSPMVGEMAEMTGTIPPQANGTLVLYYFTLSTDGAGTSTAPSGAYINPYSLFVGELDEIYCEDFESDDGDYAHELISGGWEEGADDWMWGTPIGLGGDPDFASSGSNVWGNDLGGGAYNGEYQNGKHNRLTSIDIDVGDNEELVLQYRRWLNVEDGYYDQANILANDQQVWTNHATRESIGTEHHQDDQWILHSVPIEADGTGKLTLSWDIVTDRGLTMGGWNIDDVCVYAVRPFDGSGSGSGSGPGGSGNGTDGTDGSDGDAEVGEYVAPGLTGIVPGKRVGCSCSSTSNGRISGWLSLIFIGMISAARRKER